VIRKFYDAATEAAGGAAIISEIKSLGAQHTQHVEKLAGEVKTAAVEAAEKATNEAFEKKSAEIQVKLDELDKMRKEHEEREAKRGTSFGQAETKSFNQHLGEAITEATDDIAKFERREKKSLIIEMKAVGDMTVSANYTGGTTFLANQKPGIIQNPARKLHVRDIPALPKGTTTGTRFDYLKENGAGEGAIAPVAETGTKPQIDLDLIEATAPVEVIAGWLRISNKMLNNVPGLVSFLQARLLEKLLIVEDDQLINGNGTSPNISGILDTGNFTAAAGAATVNIEQLVQAISQLEELERTADGILLRPSDFWAMALTKASGSGEYDLPGIVTFVDNQLRIAGVPAYRTTAMTVDKFIVGDFGMGAMLLQRSAPRIEFFREDGTNVRENKVTVRIEEEIAFPIFGSDYFIYGDLGDVA
jgi:HK97 family phage major capsid protein